MVPHAEMPSFHVFIDGVEVRLVQLLNAPYSAEVPMLLMFQSDSRRLVQPLNACMNDCEPTGWHERTGVEVRLEQPRNIQ